MQPATFASIGECMLELSGRGEDLWRMGFAGDTFNAAWYARAILPAESRVAYVTALGDDPFSLRMREFIGAAGVATDRIRTVPGRRPGLYAITLNEGERTFTYWRGESAARLLADDAGWLTAALVEAELLYFSRHHARHPRSRRRAPGFSRRWRSGARPARGSPSTRISAPRSGPTASAARAAMEGAYQIADVVLPTHSDEAELFGDASAEATARRIAECGAGEIVVKNGAEPCLIVAGDDSEWVAPVKPERVVDTTGAGDSFAGAYLAGRLIGMQPRAAARLGHAVAAEVIGVPGALAKIDREAVMRKAETAAVGQDLS